jgi:hypothetical protein
VKLLTRVLTRYWGYLALAVAVLGFFFHSLGLAVILALSLAALGYFLVAAPVWCCAITRQGLLCRENSHGLLLGCWRRQHKWQRLHQSFTPAGGRSSPPGSLWAGSSPWSAASSLESRCSSPPVGLSCTDWPARDPGSQAASLVGPHLLLLLLLLFQLPEPERYTYSRHDSRQHKSGDLPLLHLAYLSVPPESWGPALLA